MIRRAPIDTEGGRPTALAELRAACDVVDRSGVVAVLAPLLDAGVGRHRTISVRGLLVACQLNALARHHRAHLVEVARVVNALTDRQRDMLAIAKHDPAQTYDRVERLFCKLCEILEAGPMGTIDGHAARIDAKWLANRIARAAIPDKAWRSGSLAVDGTDLETWGALHGETATVMLDGEAADTQSIEPSSKSSRQAPKRKAKVLGVGTDGRNIYTADSDARAGHRSATNSRPAGPYVGYELHLAVQARQVRWTNNVDKITLSEEVPGVVTTFALTAAGAHRGRAIVDDLVAAKQGGAPLDDVVWDPGYSLCTPATTHHKVAAAGIHQTFQPVTHQRGTRPFAGPAIVVDGQLYSSLLPDDLRNLPAPPRGASEEEKLRYEVAFNRRARWRMSRHTGADADGATRWRCPFCVGLLRSRTFPKTMRRPATVPLVPVDTAVGRCCGGTFTAMAAELPWTQRVPFGTTAWRISMGRRQVVESANAALKGAFADVSRGFVRVFGLTKITVLLGFTLAGYNIDRVRSHQAKQDSPFVAGEATSSRRSRARRRTGTWADVIARHGTDVRRPPP